MEDEIKNEPLGDISEPQPESETQTAEEKAAFIAQMGSEAENAGEFDPSEAVKDSQPEPEPQPVSPELLGVYAALAQGGLESAEGMLKTFINPELELGEEHKANVAERAAPLMAKYGAEPPAWLIEYKDEFLFLGAVFSMGAGLHLQNKALKAQKIETLKAQRAANNSGLATEAG